MAQVHKRLATEQVKVLLKGYCHELLDRSAIEEVLGIGRSRLFALLKEYCHDPDRVFHHLSKAELFQGMSGTGTGQNYTTADNSRIR